MAEVSYIQTSKGRGESVTLLLKYVLIKATVSEGDTITVDELSNITSVTALALDDGAAIAMTALNNIITVTETPAVSEQVMILVVGS